MHVLMSEKAFKFVGLSAIPDNICFSVNNNKNEKVCRQRVFVINLNHLVISFRLTIN